MAKHSKQDLESRLRSAEELLAFIGQSMVYQTMEQLPTLGPDGNPVVRVVRKNLIEMFREYQNAELQRVAAKAAWDSRSGNRTEPSPQAAGEPQTARPSLVGNGEDPSRAQAIPGPARILSLTDRS